MLSIWNCPLEPLPMSPAPSVASSITTASAALIAGTVHPYGEVRPVPVVIVPLPAEDVYRSV